ncbi:MAG: hypothetical protein Fur0044_39010 [Anaerolineae bacterium]|nr:hypothetical protein [Anaerolineales bacterium]MCQ3974375.1 hypothetical protein [Anaerolineae bacterium]
MLFSLYPIITQNYFILCFISVLGTLQWAAARNHKPAISWLGAWGLGRVGQGVGLFLVCAGFGWFFTATPGLFTPGLAGGELTTLFAAGGLSALATARLAGVLWQREFWRTRTAISNQNDVLANKTD